VHSAHLARAWAWAFCAGDETLDKHLAIEALRAVLTEESAKVTTNNVVRQRAFSERIGPLTNSGPDLSYLVAMMGYVLSRSLFRS
jgi:hypothetical protein